MKTKAQAAKRTAGIGRARMAPGKVKTGKETGRKVLREHIVTHAGRWDGYCSGEELMRKTRP